MDTESHKGKQIMQPCLAQQLSYQDVKSDNQPYNLNF